MRVLNVLDVNEALPVALAYLRDVGKPEQTRNGPALVAPGPVATVYRRPQQRVLFDPIRDANPFFHLFESLWILAGRRDVRFLSMFNSNIANYSDDGLHYHGAYGWRLRQAFGGIDQIEVVCKMLRKNPDSRQAVLQIWSAAQDLGAQTKDVPCLAGDTRILSPEGNVCISQLFDMFELGEIDSYPVYSFNEKTTEFEFKNCTGVVCSGRKKTVRISLTNGQSIVVTPDHRMYRRWRTGGYGPGEREKGFEVVEAKSLSTGDRLLGTVFGTTRKGYVCFKKQAFEHNHGGNARRVHREYFMWKTGIQLSEDSAYDVHHIDEDTFHNNIANLELKGHSDHSADHKIGADNPIHSETTLKRRERLTKRRAALRARGWGVPDHEDDVTLAYVFKPKQKLPRKESKSPELFTVSSVTEEGEVDVYDFQVEDNHNALIGPGVVAHNCNDTVMLRVREDGVGYAVLDITVCNRSNDAIWGAYGANAVQFSFLQEYMAAKIGVGIGEYTQVSHNLHVYTENPYWIKWLEKQPAGVFVHECWYEASVDMCRKIVLLAKSTDLVAAFDDDLSVLFVMFDATTDLNTFNDTVSASTFKSVFFQYVVEPMLRMYTTRKAYPQKDDMNIDWIQAGAEWLERRAVAKWLERRVAAKLEIPK